MEAEEEQEQDLLQIDDALLLELEQRDSSRLQEEREQQEEEGQGEPVPRPAASLLLPLCGIKQWWAAPRGLDVEFFAAHDASSGSRISIDFEHRRKAKHFAVDDAGSDHT